MILFTIASLLCGIAWSLPSLIFFRILQGGVSGPMIPGSQALLISIFPPHKRGTALAIWSMTTLTAPVLGPVLGGYISDNYYWGWIFLINVPFGIITAGLTWRFLASRETPTRKLPIDAVGLGLLAFWVFSLQTMLDLGKDRDWFNNPLIVVLTICAVVGFVAWVIWEVTDKHPVVNLSFFRRRNFALGSLALCLGYALFFANNLLLPLWLQQYVGYNATWAGLVAAPFGRDGGARDAVREQAQARCALAGDHRFPVHGRILLDALAISAGRELLRAGASAGCCRASASASSSCRC